METLSISTRGLQDDNAINLSAMRFKISQYNSDNQIYYLKNLFALFQQYNLCDVISIFRKDDNNNIQSILFLPPLEKNIHFSKRSCEKLEQYLSNIIKNWKIPTSLGRYEDLKDKLDAIPNDHQLSANLTCKEFSNEELVSLFSADNLDNNICGLLIRSKNLAINNWNNEMLIFLFSDTRHIDIMGLGYEIEEILNLWINAFQAKIQEFQIAIGNIENIKEQDLIIKESEKIIKLARKIIPWLSLQDFFHVFERMKRLNRHLCDVNINKLHEFRIRRLKVALIQLINLYHPLDNTGVSVLYKLNERCAFMEWMLYRIDAPKKLKLKELIVTTKSELSSFFNNYNNP